ncbi:MAG: radical SAM protein [Candidatus Aminicenantes bacterium]|nr:radical SAM protein [Candidatus Aminicenantes bacterium]
MSEKKERARFTCDWIFNILVVLCDGKVVCGCADPYGERPLGYLQQSSLHEIWNSEKVKGIREGLNKGYAAFCLDCGLKRFLEEKEEVPVRPVHLEILPRIFLEPTVLCNLSCFQAVCNHESGIAKTRKRSKFPFDEFQSVIDEVGKNLIRLDLFNYGDPFVHPQAVEMIEYVKQKYPSVYLYTTTNGLILDDEKIRRIVRSGLDEFTFSVDGPDQETYIRYRRLGDFEKVLKIMSKFVEERNKLGREVPFINWRYILFKWNDSRGKMNKARALAAKIGVDRLTWEITDHPREALSKKYQIGTRHWRKIYHEIWDTSQIGNAIKDKKFLAKIKVLTRDLVTQVNKPRNIQVLVKNIGGAPWLKDTYSGRRIIRLGVQLFDQDKNLRELNYARAFLNRPMARGEEDIIRLDLPSWPSSGEYWLKFDMVSEGIDWFEAGGSSVVWKRYKVLE